MAVKTTKALNMELMALAPECEGPKVQELESLIYKLPGVRKAEYDATEAETKRLHTVVEGAKGGHVHAESMMPGVAMVAAREESDSVVTGLVMLAIVWEGSKGEELVALAKQLPRAVKAERTPADARMESLRHGVTVSSPPNGEDARRWQANQLGAVVGAAENKMGNGKAPPSGPAAMRAPAAPARTQVSGRPNLQAEADAPVLPQPPPSAGMRHPASHRHQRMGGDYQRRAPEAYPASALAVNPHTLNGAPTRLVASSLQQAEAESQRRAAQLTYSPPPARDPFLQRPPHGPQQPTDWVYQQSELHKKRPAPEELAHTPSSTTTLPPPSKLRKTEQVKASGRGPARPTCGYCNFKNLACDGKARCQRCKGRRCVYQLCEKGPGCKSRKCNRLHPGQWEGGDAEGKDYLVKGVNIFQNGSTV